MSTARDVLGNYASYDCHRSRDSFGKAERRVMAADQAGDWPARQKGKMVLSVLVISMMIKWY